MARFVLRIGRLRLKCVLSLEYGFHMRWSLTEKLEHKREECRKIDKFAPIRLILKSRQEALVGKKAREIFINRRMSRQILEVVLPVRRDLTTITEELVK